MDIQMSIETDWDSCPSEVRTLSLIFIPSLKGCDGYHFGFWFQDWVERIKDAGSSGLTFKRIKWCLRFLRLGQNNNGHLNTPHSSQFTLRIGFHLFSSWTVGMIRTAKNWELSILYIWSSGFYCRMIRRGQKAMTQTAWDCFLMFFFSGSCDPSRAGPCIKPRSGGDISISEWTFSSRDFLLPHHKDFLLPN